MMPVYEMEADEEEERRHVAQLRSTSRAIGMARIAAVVLSLGSAGVLIAVFAVSTAFPTERRLVFGSLLGAFLFTLLGLLAVVRNDPQMTIVVTVLLSYVGGTALGLGTGFL